MPPGYVSVAQFAEKVGVDRSRINHLRKVGRIEGARYHVASRGYVIPADARILPANKEYPGPVNDYIKAWYQRNKAQYQEGA
jgi:hypothetical protein